MTSPSNQSVFTEGQPIRLAISTIEKAGDIQALDYRSGDDIVTSFSAAPYAYTWTNATPGTHTLSARASTRRGFDVTSDPKTVLVRAANDLFANRRFVAGADVSLEGWLGGGSLEPGEPKHSEWGPLQSICWTWTVPRSGRTSIQCVSTGAIPMVAVYEGPSIDALTLVAAHSPIEFNAVEGRSYHIAVARTEEIPFHINLHMLLAATNDLFADRINVSGTNLWIRSHSVEASLEPGEPTIPGTPSNDQFSQRELVRGWTFELAGDLLGATRELNEPYHLLPWFGPESLWYTWTAPSSGEVFVTSLSPSSIPVISPYRGDHVAALSPVPISQPRQRFNVERGVTYQLAFGGRGSLSQPLRALVELWPTPFEPPPLEVQWIPRPGGFRIRVAGLRGSSIELLFSPDLMNWNVVASYQGDASFFDYDLETIDPSCGFFRVRAIATQ